MTDRDDPENGNAATDKSATTLETTAHCQAEPTPNYSGLAITRSRVDRLERLVATLVDRFGADAMLTRQAMDNLDAARQRLREMDGGAS